MCLRVAACMHARPFLMRLVSGAICCGPCGREYNAFVASVAGEVGALRDTQAAAIAQQMALDEESLQRLKAEKADAKVGMPLKPPKEKKREWFSIGKPQENRKKTP